jgi:hypothetical protein
VLVDHEGSVLRRGCVLGRLGQTRLRT